MTESEVLAYFDYIKRINCMINNKIDEKHELFTLATKSTAGVSDGMPTGKGGTSDKVGNLTVKICEIEEEITELIDDYANYRREAAKYLHKLPADQCEVIYKSMVSNQKVVKIAKDMEITTQWAHKLKEKGLESLKEIIIDSKFFEKYRVIFEIV